MEACLQGISETFIVTEKPMICSFNAKQLKVLSQKELKIMFHSAMETSKHASKQEHGSRGQLSLLPDLLLPFFQSTFGEGGELATGKAGNGWNCHPIMNPRLTSLWLSSQRAPPPRSDIVCHSFDFKRQSFHCIIGP